MKKSTITLLMMIWAASLFAGSVQYTYYFNSPVVKTTGTFTTISFDNTLLTGKTGEPSLPYHAVKLLLPPGEEAISVNYTFENETFLEGTYSIYPQQPSQPLSIGGDGTFHQIAEVYKSRSKYPVQAWGEFTTQFMNGHSFLLAAVTPVNYIPAEGKVSYFGKITVTIETRSTDRSSKALENLNTSAKVDGRVKALAQNPSMIASYPIKSIRDGEYQILIITPQSFAGSYQPLIDLYMVRGLKTEIATTEDIQANSTGQDLPEKMRNYIIAEYQSHGVQYVLLGGDAEQVPYRGFYCFVQSSSAYEDNNIPADLYFSSLDGNWNTDGDGSWGEIGEDDLLPDVAVARYPVSTVSQLQKLILKTVRYQDAPILGELRKVLIAGENLWSDPLTYGEDYLELLIGYRADNGYETTGIPEDYNFTKLYDSEASWTGYDLINKINQGTSFVHHSGHANETYVMRLDISDINNSNFAQTNGIDHNYTLVYTHGCLDGAFDVSDCIGEAMVCIDNFAVAGGFNSRYGWFNEGQTEGPSAHLHREFVDALYYDKEWRIGAAHMISKIETSVWVNAPGQWEEGALRWCFYDCNIFGDPVLGVWTDEPLAIDATYPEEIMPGSTSVPVTVTSNGQPVEGMACVILSNGVILGSGTTDASGQVSVTVPGGFEGLETAELVISGYNCLPHQYSLSITVGLGEPGKEISGLKVQPNPFTDNTSLVFELASAGQVKASFYDLSGKLVTEFICDANAGLNNFRINAGDWPEGLIQARIISGDQVIHARLLHTRK